MVHLQRTCPPSAVQSILNQWQLFCEKPPKGFEKYFKQSGAASSKTDPPADGKENVTEPTKEAKDSPPKKSSSPKSTSQPPNNDWNFGMFNTNQSKNKGGGSGRPIGGDGNENRDKMLMIGAIGTVAFLASIAYFEMGYREIGWKEFVNK